MMKHAYLILAHNEFPVLKCLIKALDNPENDIYIHFDKKVKELPEIKTWYSDLYILKSRTDVSWGDVSVVEAEYALFEEASANRTYIYYHLLSGVDMPLKSQAEIHDFFLKNKGKEFIGYSQYNYNDEVDRKANRYHLFPKKFRNTGAFSDTVKKMIRFVYMKFQYVAGIRRNMQVNFRKGTQWVSLTDDFVKYMISKKNEVLKIYQNTFCSDEIFIQTICWNSAFRNEIFNYNNEAKGCLRMIGWKNGVLHDWENKDYDKLIQSEYLFARKFNSQNMEVVKQILNHII
ncbi:Core-2/I-Branching enzyme [Elizabethkingia miricola]|nr:Core-2/I-Branching enzyme [Elizabethkingia miricola]